MSEAIETQRQYSVKFFYAKTEKRVNNMVNKWQENMRTKPHIQLDVVTHEPVVFQFGPSGLWVYYGVAILYKAVYVP